MACTTILVGKNASYDGSTLVARNDDACAGRFVPKKFHVVLPKEQPRKYRSEISHVEIDLPDNPLRYTSMPDAVYETGIWAAMGVNELNVSVTATETITSNERVLGADPLVVYSPSKGKKGTKSYVPEKIGGIGEEDIVTLVLPYIKSAREGVFRLGELLRDYGTYEMNAIFFQDENEIWCLETIGGHHFMAKKVPDDCYVVMPNQQGIDSFDLKDGTGKQQNHLCSPDLPDFIKKHHLDLSLDGTFNPRLAFGSHSDFDHSYNTPRAYILQKYFNPKTSKWTGENADYTPFSDDLPWCRVPERKITVEDVKYALSNHFQGTEYDPYAHYGNSPMKGALRPIGINRNNVVALVQIRPYMPDEIKVVKWIALGCNVFNTFVPFYTNITKTPTYLNNATSTPDTHNFYWASRFIAALADAHFTTCVAHIEHYQTDVQSRNHELIEKFDTAFLNAPLKGDDAVTFCENANDEIAKMLEEETNIALNNVLYDASCHMKNSYSRSDA